MDNRTDYETIDVEWKLTDEGEAFAACRFVAGGSEFWVDTEGAWLDRDHGGYLSPEQLSELARLCVKVRAANGERKMTSEQTYRRLRDGEVVKIADEYLDKNCVDWLAVTSATIGMKYDSEAFVTMRRKIEKEVEPKQPIKEKMTELMGLIYEHCHPHTTAIVTGADAELVEGVVSVVNQKLREGASE